MARLDQLGPAKGTAQLGATIGREFSAALLQAVTPLDEDLVRQDLHTAGGGGAALPAGRGRHGGVSVQARPDSRGRLCVAAAENAPALPSAYCAGVGGAVSRHRGDPAGTAGASLHRGGAPYDQAVAYWQRAGQRALERSAYVEATSHLTTGLEVLTHLPDTSERHRHELELQLTLALALHASKGQAAPEVEQAYARARELCGQVDDTPQLFRALLGLYRFYGGRIQLQTSRELTEQLYSLAQRAQDPDLLLEAHMARGTIALLLGEHMTARRHLEQAIALYDVQHHRSHALRYGVDPGVISLSRMSWVLWLLGYPDQALCRSQETLALAQTLRTSLQPGKCAVLCGDVPSVPSRSVGRPGIGSGYREPRNRARVGAMAGEGHDPPGLGVDGARTQRRRPGADASGLDELPGDGNSAGPAVVSWRPG